MRKNWPVQANGKLDPIFKGVSLCLCYVKIKKLSKGFPAYYKDTQEICDVTFRNIYVANHN